MDNLPALYRQSTSSRHYDRMHFQRVIQDENNKSQEVSHTYYDCPLANLKRENLEKEVGLLNEMLHQNAEQLSLKTNSRNPKSYISNLYIVDINYEEEKITLVLNKMGTDEQNLPKRNAIAFFHLQTTNRADVNDPSANAQFKLRFDDVKRKIKSCANITSPQVPLTFTQKLTQEVIHDLIPSRETINKSIGEEIGKFLFIKLAVVPMLQRIIQTPQEKEFINLTNEVDSQIQLLQQFKRSKKISQIIRQADENPTAGVNATKVEDVYLNHIEETIHSLSGNPA